MPAEIIRVRGQVQGVGFRPFIWRLAAAHDLRGDVRNDAEGVLIRAEGADLDAFAAAIHAEKPPLARIDAVERRPLDAPLAAEGFAIIETAGGAARTRVAPDAATCRDCLAEIMNPAERRAGYAFANCTHCGPRFSIVERIPYDRAATTMRRFGMCADCAAEYADPADRRFHAQPIACPVCGPRLWLEAQGAEIAGEPIALAAERLAAGEILAIKGIGGFHLACDARNEDAVAALRRRKRRPGKPFALMATLDQIRRSAMVSAEEATLLADPAAPIVLLAGAEEGGSPLAPSIAPGLDRIGWMLPYTPLHHLLLAAAQRPLVMTSGNLSGEPQVIGNEEAREKLSGFAEAFLMHDRPIARRLDDSVARIWDGAPQLLRRARGFAPSTLTLPPGFEAAAPVLAAGGDLKGALCLTRDGAALPSHHLGDLEDPLSYDAYETAAADYAALFDHAPEAVACDLHPDFHSTRFAEAAAARLGAPLIRIQHHHAHIASAMAEQGWPLDGPPVLGVALDGAGYGPDGTIWGGEILLCDYRGYRRIAHLAPAALPGGSAAAREPWRCLVAQLHRAYPDWSEAQHALAGAGIAARLAGKPIATLRRMIESGANTPATSSAGRLFDAVAASLGIAFDGQSYEGETGMRLEAMARGTAAGEGYAVALRRAGEALAIDPAPIWPALLGDLRAGRSPAEIARRFQDGLAAALIAAVAAQPPESYGAIALSGGVAQNALLLNALIAGLGPKPVLIQRQTPANDGGLALGQAAIAAARLLKPGAAGPDMRD